MIFQPKTLKANKETAMAIDEAYATWLKTQDKASMAGVLKELQPLLDTEIHRYNGPKALLRNKARILAAGAVRTYKPDSGAKLSSWIVTSLQPLTRYGRTLSRPVHTSELAYRQAAEVDSVRKRLNEDLGAEPTDAQLADETGLSVPRIQKIRAMTPAYATQSAMEQVGDTGEPASIGVENKGPDPMLETATQAVYAGLDERDRAIFDLKTGRNGREALDNKAIARRLGVSEGLVSQRSLLVSNLIQESYGKI
jgi:DNA-directed RNA polymerase specialized sigma subunit